MAHPRAKPAYQRSGLLKSHTNCRITQNVRFPLSLPDPKFSGLNFLFLLLASLGKGHFLFTPHPSQCPFPFGQFCLQWAVIGIMFSKTIFYLFTHSLRNTLDNLEIPKDQLFLKIGILIFAEYKQGSGHQ